MFLFVCWGDPFKGSSGTEIFVRYLALATARHGHLVHLVYGTRAPDGIDAENIVRHPIHHSRLPVVRTFKFRRSLASLVDDFLEQQSMDAVIFFGAGTYPGYVLQRLRAAPPLILYYAMDSMKTERMRSRGSKQFSGFYNLRQTGRYWAMIRAEQEALERADMVLASSLDTASNLQSDYEFDKSKIRLLYEGIPDDFSAGIDQTSPKRPVFFHVGGAPRKGTDLFLAALDLLQRKYSIRADGIITRARAVDEAGVRELGVSTKLYRFLDAETYKMLMASSTALVCPSYSEGFCLPVIEAAMLGVPSIVTNVGSLPELVKDTENGFVIPVGDVATLVERMRTLSTDDELRAKMKSTASQKARHFRISEVISRLVKLIESSKAKN
jgi:glycosyltransferase involved in cell wall biosynthesis